MTASKRTGQTGRRVCMYVCHRVGSQGTPCRMVSRLGVLLRLSRRQYIVLRRSGGQLVASLLGRGRGVGTAKKSHASRSTAMSAYMCNVYVRTCACMHALCRQDAAHANSWMAWPLARSLARWHSGWVKWPRLGAGSRRRRAKSFPRRAIALLRCSILPPRPSRLHRPSIDRN